MRRFFVLSAAALATLAGCTPTSTPSSTAAPTMPAATAVREAQVRLREEVSLASNHGTYGLWQVGGPDNDPAGIPIDGTRYPEGAAITLRAQITLEIVPGGPGAIETPIEPRSFSQKVCLRLRDDSRPELAPGPQSCSTVTLGYDETFRHEPVTRNFTVPLARNADQTFVVETFLESTPPPEDIVAIGVSKVYPTAIIRW